MAKENQTSSTPLVTFTPSLWSRAGALTLCIILSPLIIPIFVGLWIILSIRHTRYELTSERLLLTTGILSRTTSNLELYRITDLTITQSFFQRLAGIGTIELISTDRTCPTLQIRGVRNHRQLSDTIRDLGERLRHQRGHRDFDVV